jgi:hypothetical protein
MCAARREPIDVMLADRIRLVVDLTVEPRAVARLVGALERR